MGGCRCSYRNCKVRSDGQTHMFHFPVFDRVRCHLWIKNAHKPNFLNLKLSQLKNRVVCQHHFCHDSFMNFKKDKLKHHAVPTEDGPYCSSASVQPVIVEEYDKPVIPINADDIENEKLYSVEKKAHSSVKYGDFLISDATELFNASIDNQASSKKISSMNIDSYNDNCDLEYKLMNNEDNHKYTISYVNEEKTLTKSSNQIKKSPLTRVSIEIDKSSNINSSLSTTQANTLVNMNTNSASSSRSTLNPKKMIKIISEKKISEPVLVEGKLEPVSPSMIIQKSRRVKRCLPDKQGDRDIEPIVIKQPDSDIQNSGIVFDQIVPIEYAPLSFETDTANQNSIALSSIQNIMHFEPLQTLNLNTIEDNKDSNNGTVNIQQLPIEMLMEQINRSTKQANDLEPGPAFELTKQTILSPINTTAYKSILKNKITPEKVAAIEEKRKFNLKMRDVITSCLDNLDDPNDEIFKKIAEKKQSVKQSLLKEQSLKRSLLKELKPPVTNEVNQDSIIAFLDKRLQKLETTLLNKIDLNTQRINELKRKIKPSSHTKNANTQTYLNHMCNDSQKQYLYKEISKFLSPDANIKVFQELFIENTQEEDDIIIATPRKLRRRR